MKLFKNLFRAFLSTAVIASMTVTAMAGYAEATGQFTPFSATQAYYYAYCGYSGGDASTILYADAKTTWATVDVSMTMYSIDAYFYSHTDDMEFLERNKRYVGSSDDRSSNFYNSMAAIDVEVTGASWTRGDSKYHGFKVESSHSAVTNLNNSNQVSGSLKAYY